MSSSSTVRDLDLSDSNCWRIGVSGGVSFESGARAHLRLDGSRTDSQVWSLTTTPLPSGYRVNARLRVPEPPAGSIDCAAELLLDAADPDTCYAVRFRRLTGVRYLALLRRDRGRTEVLAEGVTAYSFDTPLSVQVTVDGPRLEVALEGTVVATANDVRRLRHDAVGFAAAGTGLEVEALQVVALHDDPLPVPPDDRLGRSAVRQAQVREPGPAIDNDRYRIEFATARSARGQEVTPLVSARHHDGTWTAVASSIGEWYLLAGDYGSRADPHASLSAVRISFGSVEMLDERTVRLAADADGYQDVSVTWSLAGPHPRATVRFTPVTTGHHLAVFDAFEPLTPDEVSEVLCGPLQHARRVRGPELVGAAELTAPLALVEHRPAGRPWTRGVVVPAAELSFGDEQNRDPDDQPFGMSLRGRDGIRPVIAMPQYGRRARLPANTPFSFTIGLYTGPVPLFEAYRELLRTEYDYRPYRRNVFGQSLTDTMFNLVDLLATGPEADAEDYQGSPSGWWGRAKGFIDIENDQAVRTTTTGVLLSAAYLTDDPDLYDRRARPTIEYHLSRNAYGWTPRPGYTVYGAAGHDQLCATPYGVAALGALHEMTRRRNPVISRLASSNPGSAPDYWLQRAPMSVPLASYRLTRDDQHLAAARRLADEYLTDKVDHAATDHLDPHDFAIYYCADWIGLLELFEETGDERYLDGAYREACRFATQAFVRPVHRGTATVPDRLQYHDRQIDLSGWWDAAALYDYPVSEISPEPADRWVLSLTGMMFEALQTYRYSGPTLNPAWAPHLLRLAYHTDDSLLRDIAHNAVIGRYTNYPGYYLRQHTIAPLKPDFPFTGPFDNSTIYYHHAPAQLAMTIDYLLTEHQTRSRDRIRFPAAFEENFVWFRFRTYGHRPGEFYGDTEVWLWMPRDIVALDNHQVSWVSAVGNQRFYLSLSNASADPQTVRVSFGDALNLRGRRTVRMIDDGVERAMTMTGPTLDVDVGGHGLTALVLDDVGPVDVAMRRGTAVLPDTSYRFDDITPVGRVTAMLLARPDSDGCDAFVQSDCSTPATLRYSLDGGRSWSERHKAFHPAEWTVPVPPSTTFTYQVHRGQHHTEPAELRSA